MRIRRRNENEIERRVREAEFEQETGWHADGGRPFGHPDDVLSPAIRALQVIQRFRRDRRGAEFRSKVSRSLVLAILSAFVLALLVAVAIDGVSWLWRWLP